MTDPRTPTSDPVAAARKRLTDGRVKTDNLSVPSIIETYANRLLDLHYDDADRASIVEERDDLLAWYAVSEAEARQQARAALAALNDYDWERHYERAEAPAGLQDAARESPEPASHALFIGADGTITDPNDDGRVVPAVTLDYESVWYHQGWERGYATAKAEAASPEPASPGSGLDAAWKAAEDALPEGYDLMVGHTSECQSCAGWWATASKRPEEPPYHPHIVSSETGRPRGEHHDATPAAALLALARRPELRP